MDNFFPPSNLFDNFLDLNANRLDFIESWLKAKNISTNRVKLANKTHLIVKFDSSFYDPRFKAKTLIAHYDRVKNSPAANDNSIACFLLMDLAKKLQSGEILELKHNIKIIFTDGEEAASSEGIKGQGSYALGEGLRRLGLVNSDIYVFDACGLGDTIVVSTSGFNQNLNKKTKDKLEVLHNQASRLAIKTSPNSWIKLPTPFSDNAGLLANGIVSQLITVLPSEEASMLLKNLKIDKTNEYLKAICLGGDSLKNGKWYVPKTWQLFHSPEDKSDTLTPKSFELIAKFLEHFAKQKIPNF